MHPSKTQISVGIQGFFSCGQRRLRSDGADAQSDLSLRWAQRSFCWFSHAAALSHILKFINHLWGRKTDFLPEVQSMAWQDRLRKIAPALSSQKCRSFVLQHNGCLSLAFVSSRLIQRLLIDINYFKGVDWTFNFNQSKSNKRWYLKTFQFI